MNTTFQSLNLRRRPEFIKRPEQENLLLEINRALQPLEHAAYEQREIEHPFIFVFGLPRSGTTLLTQLVARSLDVGYISNFVARFWLTPVTGIRLARVLGLDRRAGAVESTFGATANLEDIHEFGYFWRHWLEKATFEDVARAREREDELNWDGLRSVLANVQAEFAKPVIMKNVLGSYHLGRLRSTLRKVLYLYIERDELDVAVSILDARRKYYGDPGTWWSYVPPDYAKIIDLDYWHQIAGQVHYLKSFYYREMSAPQIEEVLVRVDYADLVRTPDTVLSSIADRAAALYGNPIPLIDAPPQLVRRSYENRSEDKQKFARLLTQMRQADE